jgi:tetratricopeptide (TPR) repeat protein
MNWRPCILCLTAAIGAAAQTSVSEWDRLMAAGWTAVNAANYAGGERFYSAALRLAEADGRRDIRLARTLAHFGHLRSVAGNCEEGVRLGSRALRIYETLADVAPDEVGHAWLNLARSYYCRGLFSNAEHAFRKALPLEERARNHDKAEVAEILTALAAVYQIRRNDRAAMEAADRAAGILREIPESDPHSRALLLNNLGAIYNRSGRPAEAEKTLRQGLRAAQTISRDHGVSEFYIRTNLAILVHEQGRHAEANSEFSRGLEIVDRGAPLPGFEVEKFLRSFATCMSKLGRKSDARQMTARANTLRRQNPDAGGREWTVGFSDLRGNR